ncbi:MAG: hypothetical protein HYX89_02600 [Chloroflexi bacterium]|nr:hypothetical protein [Chloroflexota bacterium]
MALKTGIFAPNSPTLMFPDRHQQTVAALREIAAELQIVELLVVASPHFFSRGGLKVEVSPKPRFLQDYHGFPEDWYNARYEPPGEPEAASKLVEAGKKAGLPVQGTDQWGIDHGAWTPLLHLIPQASVPTICLSISDLPWATHRQWGQVIRRTLDGLGKSWALVATGALTHRLDMITWDENRPFPEGEQYDREVLQRLTEGRFDEIDKIDPQLERAAAPEGNNRTLAILLGALGPLAKAEVLSYERMYTGVSLTTVVFRVAQAVRG